MLQAEMLKMEETRKPSIQETPDMRKNMYSLIVIYVTGLNLSIKNSAVKFFQQKYTRMKIRINELKISQKKT